MFWPFKVPSNFNRRNQRLFIDSSSFTCFLFGTETYSSTLDIVAEFSSHVSQKKNTREENLKQFYNCTKQEAFTSA